MFNGNQNARIFLRILLYRNRHWCVPFWNLCSTEIGTQEHLLRIICLTEISSWVFLLRTVCSTEISIQVHLLRIVCST
jgi:hypothetical protein